MKLTTNNSHVKWYSHNEDEYYYYSIYDLIEVGTPIDNEGENMEQVDDFIYVISNGEYVRASVEKNA
jgi:hypothetical protein